MKRVLLTGMSGAGKSGAVAELVARGPAAVDTDDSWCDVQADGRRIASAEIRTTAPPDVVVDERLRVAGLQPGPRGAHR